MIAFFHTWIEIMFKLIDSAAKKYIFHWNCCYTCTKIVKCNANLEGDGRRGKKSFRFAQLSHAGVRGGSSITNCLLQLLNS